MLKIENMTSERSGRAVANQFVITTDKEITFQSYESIVAIYNNNTRVIKIYNDIATYSRTTTKYLKRFLDIYIPFNGKKNIQRIIKAVKKNKSYYLTLVNNDMEIVKV